MSDLSTLSCREIADIIDYPLERWPGSCNIVAMSMLDEGIVTGDYLAGSYLGEVAKGTFFSSWGRRQNGIGHCWIDLGGDRYLDPTRWVFEGTEPYIWIGPMTDYKILYRLKIEPIGKTKQ